MAKSIVTKETMQLAHQLMKLNLVRSMVQSASMLLTADHGNLKEILSFALRQKSQIYDVYDEFDAFKQFYVKTNNPKNNINFVREMLQTDKSSGGVSIMKGSSLNSPDRMHTLMATDPVLKQESIDRLSSYQRQLVVSMYKFYKQSATNERVDQDAFLNSFIAAAIPPAKLSVRERRIGQRVGSQGEQLGSQGDLTNRTDGDDVQIDEIKANNPPQDAELCKSILTGERPIDI